MVGGFGPSTVEERPARSLMCGDCVRRYVLYQVRYLLMMRRRGDPTTGAERRLTPCARGLPREEL